MLNDVDGGAGSDTIEASAYAGSNVLDGGSGTDVLTASCALDFPGAVRNEIHGGADNDTIAGTADAASFEVVARNLLYGDAGDDHIVAVGGSDAYGDFLTLTGGDPWSVANILSGGSGNDTLTGSNHRDIFACAAGDGTDLITYFQDGHDKFGLAGGLTFAQLKISASGAADTLIEVTASGEDLAVVQGIAPAAFDATDFILI